MSDKKSNVYNPQSFLDIFSKILGVLCLIGFYVGWLIIGNMYEIIGVTILLMVVIALFIYAFYGDNPTF